MLDFFSNLFNTHGFPPRWHCGVWTSGHGWLHILSDLGIWSAYYAIPLILIYFAYRRRDVPFRKLFWLFGVFILACGTIHLMDAAIFWWPAYRFLGLIKFITAIASWTTVVALVPVIPRALLLKSPTELEAEVKERTADLAVANEALRQGEERLRLALEAGHMGTWDWDLRTNRVIWSSSMETIHGLAPGDYSGLYEDFRKLVHPEDQEQVPHSIEEAIHEAKDNRIEYRLLRADRSVRWVESRGRLMRDPAGTPVRMIGVAIDITDQKRTEQSLRFLAGASRSLATLIDFQSTMQTVAHLAVPTFADWCGVFVLGEDGKLEQLATAHADPVKGALVDELAKRHPLDSEQSVGAARIVRTGKAEILEEIPDSLVEQSAADDKQRRLMCELRPKSYIGVPMAVRDRLLGAMLFFLGESGRRYNGSDLAVAEDLAQRAAAAIENARLYAQVREADRRKDEFLAMLAHELRNPLAPIRSGLDLLAMSGVESDTVQLMLEQVEHLVRLVDDLLDVSRILRGKSQLRKEPVPLSVVVQRSLEAVRPLMEAQGHDLKVSLPSNAIWLEADPVRLAQAITNVLNNAAKYTEKGGRIELAVRQESDQAVIAVRDNGIGIEAALLPQIFEPFTQADRSLDRSQGGLGIGLTLVRSLVEMHGGTAEAHSEGLGKGSEFVLRLPVSSRPHKEQLSRPRPISTSPRRILIVEDNVGTAKVLSRLLAKTGGHEIRMAHDGRAGLELAKAFRPELILLDIGLPGMNGYEVALRLREEPGGDATLLVALTGYGQEEDRRRSKEAGFDEHLLKPPSLDMLQQLFSHPKLNR